VIHCNGVAAWPILAAAKVRRIPVIQHVRIATLTGLEDRLSAAQRLIAVSRFVSGELLRVGATPDRVHVCYNGIDTRELRPSRTARAAGRRLFALDPQAFVLLCLARCDRSKRLDVVVRAFAQTARRRRQACLLIVGEVDDPIYFESVRQLIAQQRLEARVRFLRGVEDIRLLHAAADALMLASVREPLGNSVLEAMAMATPVVAAASGGIPEILDSSCGTLVDPDAVDGFGRALLRIATGDPELLRKARQARRVVERRFNLDDHLEAMRQHYREVTT
jgi:glycosyltransferase involved in cell wall biosynthesis